MKRLSQQRGTSSIEYIVIVVAVSLILIGALKDRAFAFRKDLIETMIVAGGGSLSTLNPRDPTPTQVGCPEDYEWNEVLHLCEPTVVADPNAVAQLSGQR